MEALAVIPARGGSVRIPRKVMRDICGMPMLAYTLDAATGAESITRVIVSTEDVEIAAYCKRGGIEVVPQPLDSALSGTMSAPVVLSALDFLRDTEGYEPDAVCLLHPTSPLRTAEHIDEAFKLWRGWRNSVVSFTRDTLNGAIYVCDTGTFRDKGSFFGAPVLPYEMDEAAGLDVDTWDDLERARVLLSGRAA